MVEYEWAKMRTRHLELKLTTCSERVSFLKVPPLLIRSVSHALLLPE